MTAFIGFFMFLTCVSQLRLSQIIPDYPLCDGINHKIICRVHERGFILNRKTTVLCGLSPVLLSHTHLQHIAPLLRRCHCAAATFAAAVQQAASVLMLMPPKKGADKTVEGITTAIAAAKNPWWKGPEVTVLLAAVRQVLPLGDYHWQDVYAAYNASRPVGSVERNADSCKTKFKALKNTKKASGVANPPWDVMEAKEIQQLIEAKMQTAELDDQQPEGAEVEGESGDDDDAGGEQPEDEGGEGSQGGSAQPSPSTPVHAVASARNRPEKSPGSVAGSPNDKPLTGAPERLGVSTHQPGVIASTATAKRARLERQIADEKQQRAEAAESRLALLTAMMTQQNQQFQLQMQQQQLQQQSSERMQMMMMMMMSKMTGIPLPSASDGSQAPAPPQHP